jgi:SAM-dependent methyltransferase
MATTSQTYTDAWDPSLAASGQQSPRTILPLLQQLVPFESVVDLGCGTGTWLAAFEAAGIRDVLGVEGEWIDAPDGHGRKAALQVPRDRLLARDLAQPLRLDRTFDLAMSLEVAEHLPPDAAGPFVASLTGLAPVVMFSAAAPFQGGTGHLNEQWPSYWARLFEEHGFVGVDCLRPQIWADPSVAWYYRQNVVLFVRRSALADHPALAELHGTLGGRVLDMAHPERYVQLARTSNRVAYERTRGLAERRAPRLLKTLRDLRRR